MARYARHICIHTHGNKVNWFAYGDFSFSVLQVVSYSCGPDSKFSAAAEAHPAMVDPADAPGIAVPMCVLASKDEDAEAVQAFEKALKVPCQVETFPEQVHGFMAARAELTDEKIRGEYERGYQTLVDFFGKYL